MQRSTDVRLRIKQIRDANLDWVRKDAGPHDDDLLKSLRDDGMMLPILLTNELVVADGARRLLRAERLGWRDVPVVVTTDWSIVHDYYTSVRELEATGAPHEPMTWAEIVDLVNGPLDLLYRRRRLERGRASRAATAAAKAAGQPLPRRSQTNKDIDYVGEAADVLGWQRSDLRTLREIHRTLADIEAREAEQRKLARKKDGAAAANAIPERAKALRDEVQRLEHDGGFEGGVYALLRKLRLIVAGKDVGAVGTGRAKRRIGEPTLAQRKAAIAANPAAVGRDMDTQTMTRLAKVLTDLGIEVDEYTHMRPTVRIDDAKTAAKDIKAAVNQFNGLLRTIRRYTENLEESS